VRADSTTELSTDGSISFKETVDSYRLADTAPFIARNTPVQAIMPNNSLIDTDDDLKLLLTKIFGSAQRYHDDDLCSIQSLNEVSEDFMNPITF
jgi:hypothetical protein